MHPPTKLLLQGTALALLVVAGRTLRPSDKREGRNVSPTPPPQNISAIKEPWQILELREGQERNLANLKRALLAALNEPGGAEAALRWIAGLPELGWQQELLVAFFENQVGVAPRQALAAWDALAAGFRTPSMAARLAAGLASLDRASGVAWAEKLPPKARAAALKAIYSFWIQRDTAAAAAYLTQMPGDALRHELILLVATEWGRLRPEKTLSWLAQVAPLNPTAHHLALAQLVRALAERDPVAAQRLAEQPGAAPEAVSTLAGFLAKKDATAALAWARRTGVPEALAAVIREWALRAPQEAAAATGELSGPLRTATQDSVLRTWALQDAAPALAWAKDLPQEEAVALYKAFLAGSAAGEYGNLAALTEARAKAFQALQERDAAAAAAADISANARSIGQKWAEWQPQAALDWALSLSGNGRSEALTGSLWMALERDWETYSQWFQTQTRATQDQGVLGAVLGAARFHPQTAMDWAAQYASPEHSAEDLRGRAYQIWLKNDPPAAQSWVNGSHLSQAEKLRLQALRPAAPW